MTEWPNLGIVLLTYKRTEEAIRTIKGIYNNLGYPKEKRGWYVADDGSDGDHLERLLGTLDELGEKVIGSHSERFSPYTGIGWNKAIGIAFQFSDYVLLMEDDWELSGNFDMNPNNHPGKTQVNPYLNNGILDIRPYIEMLSEREDVGIVRLGGLAVGSDVGIVGHNGHHYLNYLKNTSYAYSGNPHIRHARFMRSYGEFSKEVKRPGELELDLDWRFRHSDGPAIWRPADIPGWGVFHHIGNVRYSI
ncbi:MAG: hypothetical protein JRJ45_05040 [Deltaproteobacteria bacterium]|nr:hypothetical protein [Deltaproteobacteria bacterium]